MPFPSALRKFAALLTLAYLPAGIAGDEPPALMQLDYLKAGERLHTTVAAEPGLKRSPHAGHDYDRVAITTGDLIDADARPREHTVRFYYINTGQRIPVCFVRIRYFRSGDGEWQPRYQLEQEPVLAWDGARWKPADTPAGKATLIILTGRSVPNAYGYYRSLEFGLAAGQIRIDAWQVE